MSFHVQRKVVTARETPLANFAFERLCTRVLPIMARQLVRPGGEHEQQILCCWTRVLRLTKIICFQTWQIGCYTRAIDTYTAFLLRIFQCQKIIQKLCLISFSLIKFKSLLIHAVIQLLDFLTKIFTHFFLAGLKQSKYSLNIRGASSW